DNAGAGERYLPSSQGRSGWILADLLKGNFIITSTVLLRRLLLDQVGMFSEDIALEDYELWLRIARVSQVQYIPEPLALYYRQNDSYSRGRSEALQWNRLIQLFE